MKNYVFILISFFLFNSQVNASHLMGGEITWECNGSGQFIFNMKIYRDCNGISGPSGVSLTVSNCSSLTTIPMNDISQTDISPVCDAAGPAITCAGATGSTAGAVEEFVYQSNPITISGTPPAAGWIFTYTDCCRNASITNLVGASGYGFTLRAKMYAYNNQNTDPCYDSSPIFTEKPATIICTTYPFTYNNSAYDKDLDSLVYSWDEPLDQLAGTFTNTNPAAVPFAAGYSVTSPLPSTAQNSSNIAATLNSSTGEIAFTSYTAGNFVTVVKVQAYKCGSLVAEVYREGQVVLLSCDTNNHPPTVTPPFKDPNTGLYTLFADTVYAGALVTFSLSATDFEYLPSGSAQSCYIEASGSQFGTGFTSTTSGCLYPPCATLNPAPPTSAQFGVATTFSWQTSCDHSYSANCFSLSNTYIFVLKMRDDYCPAPGLNVSTISITVLPNNPVVTGLTSFCQGDSTTLTASSGYDSYLWSNGDTTKSITVKQSGAYSVSVSNDSICVGTSFVSINVFNNIPVANFNYSDTGLFVSFNDTSEYGNNYFWDFGDGTTSTQQNPTHLYATTGTYVVSLIVNNPCGADTIYKTIVLLTGIEKENIAPLFNIYPNPNNGFLNISAVLKKPETITIGIQNLLGEQVFFSQENNALGNYVKQININRLPQGMYFISISLNGQIKWVSKIVKE